MNVYVKYCPNVFVAKCTEKHEKGEIIQMRTKYGKEHNCIVWNCLGVKEGFFFYSVTREDGLNAQKIAEKRAQRIEGWVDSNVKKSEEFYKRSKKDDEFLSLGEPIKIGHHSEKRHRKIIEQADNNMRKSVEFLDRSEYLKSKAEYWKDRMNDINLSMPESLEYFEFKLEEARMKHEKLKSGEMERSHSYSLTYANKEVKELERKLETAKKLWT